MSKNYSNIENENFANRSANPLEDSIADPGRAPQRLEGLSSFLIEEYYRRYGIYTQDAQKLFKFWKDHVSHAYREVRERKAQEKAQQGHFQTMHDFGLGDFTQFDNFIEGMGVSPADPVGKKQHSADYTTPNLKKPHNSYSKTNKTTTAKPPGGPQKKKSNLEKQYERFGTAYELDVRQTIEKDIKQIEDDKNIQNLRRENAARERKMRDDEKRNKLKIDKMLHEFYLYKFEVQVRKHLQSKKEGVKPEKKAKKPSVDRIQEERSRSKLRSLSRSLERIKSNYQRGNTFASRSGSGARSKSRSISPKKLNLLKEAWFKRHNKPVPEDLDPAIAKNLIAEQQVVHAVMNLVLKVKLTNVSSEIIQIYRENKMRCDFEVPGGESSVQKIITEFFTDENCVRRLVLFGKYVSPSLRRGQVPLFQFYQNLKPDDRKLNMVERSHTKMIKLSEDEKKGFTEIGIKTRDEMPHDEYVCSHFEW